MSQTTNSVTLVHVTTVPQSLGFFRGQVQFMKRHGFSIHALSSPGPELQAFSLREGATVHSIEMPRRITPIRDLVAVGRIWQYFMKIRPDIVHAHTPKGGLLGMTGAWLSRVPVRIYHIHGLPLVTAAGYKRVLLRLSEWVACRLADQVLCVSESVREVAIGQGLCPKEKIKVLHRGSINGVDAERRFNPSRMDESLRHEVRRRYSIPDDALVLGFVGRLVRDKGIAELAQAWTFLRDKHPHLHLLLVGELERQDPIPPDANRLLRTDDRVHLTGHVEDVPSLYKAMDLMILPTHREGLGSVLLEAAAMALPVVATKIPGCINAVEDGVTGTLVPPYDQQALVCAVATYLADPERRRRHGEAGRKRVLRDYQPQQVWEATYREYRRLLQERLPASPTSRP